MPLVTADGTTTLHIESTLSDFTGEFDRIYGLCLSDRSLKTTITFREGETVVPGGILRKSISLTTTGVPGSRRLRIIGGLFRTTQQGQERTDYVVIIQAEVIERPRPTRETERSPPGLLSHVRC